MKIRAVRNSFVFVYTSVEMYEMNKVYTCNIIFVYSLLLFQGGLQLFTTSKFLSCLIAVDVKASDGEINQLLSL